MNCTVSQGLTIDHRKIEIENIRVNEIRDFEFRCVYLNIRSIRKNWTMFLVKLLNVIQHINVIVLVEINIMEEKKAENDLFQIDGFDAVFYNRPNRINGGIAVFVRNDIPYCRFVYDTTFYETIHLQLTIGTKVLSLIAVYRPPQQTLTNINSFVTELEGVVGKLNNTSELCVIGDMNINLKARGKGYVQNYLQMIKSKGMVNVIMSDTRLSMESGRSTLIDHALVRTQDERVLSAVIESNISDHYALLCGLFADTSVKGTVNQQASQLSWINDEKVLSRSAIDSAFYKRWKNNRTNESLKDEYIDFHKKSKKTIDKASKSIKKRKLRAVKKPLKEHRMA